MAEKKEKRYVSDNAQLMAEWNWEKNNALGFDPSKLTLGNHKKVWWKCALGHEWEALVNNRHNGTGCPYCSGKKVVVGVNDLPTVNPTLANEWNYEKNSGLKPESFTAHSGKKVWWKCIEGHEWQAIIYDRNKGNGCPRCSGRYAIKGKNDLQTVNPELAKEWNYEKNSGLTPMDVLPNSNKKVWWKCSEGHEWQATVNNRSARKKCPYCFGMYVIKGKNDLQTVNPELVKEWNYEKNSGLTPMDVLPNSNKKVWWKCSKDHEWKATIAHRNNGGGCPTCNLERNTSFPEYAIEYYLKKYGMDVIHPYKENGYELDIYIPSKKIAIEYDGYYWHKDKIESDLLKNKKCDRDGIKLFRVREGLLPLNSSSLDYVVQKEQKNLSKILIELLREIIGTDVDVNLKRDNISIENLRTFFEKENSILHSNPILAKEWNYEKNANLKPENFTANSGRKVWWKCALGHEWQATINDRHQGSGCPYCAGQKVTTGYNDLATINPILAKEWNYEKNANLKPENFTANSGRKVWWKCALGHEWQATICNRNKGSGCPYCAGQKVISGHNDLQTVNPDLAKEWNHEKNLSLIPENFKPNSGKKVWWKCVLGHEWQATIASRNGGRGCPECAKMSRTKKKKF